MRIDEKCWSVSTSGRGVEVDPNMNITHSKINMILVMQLYSLHTTINNVVSTAFQQSPLVHLCVVSSAAVVSITNVIHIWIHCMYMMEVVDEGEGEGWG